MEAHGNARLLQTANGSLLGTDNVSKTTGSLTVNVLDGNAVLFKLHADSGVDVRLYDVSLIRMGDAVVPVEDYTMWADSQGLTVGANDAFSDNPDDDRMDNLMEYAVNGNPLVVDSAAVLFSAADGSSDWFYHVHHERTIDPRLTYTVELNTNLVVAPIWSSNDLEYVGDSIVVDNYKSVTNRTDLESAEYIRLKVEKN